VAGLAATAIACIPAPVTKPEPTPGSVDVAGDSLTIQAFYRYGLGLGAPTDVNVIAYLGWEVGDVQGPVAADVAAGRPEFLVVALATNDANPVDGGGWTGADVDAFRNLFNTPHPSACVVVVLPGWGAGVSSAWRTELVESRGGLSLLAAQRGGRTVTVDWLAVVQAHPEYLGPDGIHLRQEGDVVDPQAANARAQLYWSGVAACPA